MIRPVKFDLFGQHGERAHTTLSLGWNPLSGINAGVWVYPTCLVFWNACPGAGELFIDHMEITFDGVVSGVLPRANWRAEGPVLFIGAGHEYVAPRASMRIRFDYPNRCPTKVNYGPARITFAPSQKRNIFTQLAANIQIARDTGMWQPFGDRQPDTPGGGGIAGLSGYEQDGPGFLLRHDLVMERMPIGTLDSTSGMPIIMQGESDYTTVRGWGKTTQQDSFVEPVHVMYDDARTPRMTWPGTSPYHDLMLGKAKRDRSYLPYDAQHLCRALAPAKAAMQCGDPVATFDLAVIAADCATARTDTSALPNGSRGLGWTVDAMMHCRGTWARAKALNERMALAQAPSGALLRAPYGYSFAPSPWAVSSTIPVPIGLEYDVDAILERAICCHAGALDGRLDLIKKALAGMPWPVSKFLAVGKGQTEIFDQYRYPVGNSGHEIWLAIGAYAALAPRDPQWRFYAFKQATPGGARASSLPELRDVLRAEVTGREQSALLVSVLEGMPL